MDLSRAGPFFGGFRPPFEGIAKQHHVRRARATWHHIFLMSSSSAKPETVQLGRSRLESRSDDPSADSSFATASPPATTRGALVKRIHQMKTTRWAAN